MGALKRVMTTTPEQRSASASKGHLGQAVSRVVRAIDELTPSQVQALRAALNRKGSSRT